MTDEIIVLNQIFLLRVTRPCVQGLGMRLGVAYVNVCVLRHLKEDLAWAIDKWLQVINNKMLFKTVVPLRD